MNTPNEIYLIDTGSEITWCDVPDPSEYIEEEDVVKYVRSPGLEWKDYPENKPEREGKYLVYSAVHDTFIADYDPHRNVWWNTLDAKILKWAEYNKPEESQ